MLITSPAAGGARGPRRHLLRPGGRRVLTTKYARGGEGRFSVNTEYQKRNDDPWFHETAVAFADLAAEVGEDPMTLANPAISCPITKARSVEQR